MHLRCGISAEKVRVTVFVEDYADEKLLFADNLRRQADSLEHYLALHPTILGYELRDADDEPKRGHALEADTLRAFADRMHRVKGQHAIFGIAFAKTPSGRAERPGVSGSGGRGRADAETALRLRARAGIDFPTPSELSFRQGAPS